MISNTSGSMPTRPEQQRCESLYPCRPISGFGGLWPSRIKAQPPQPTNLQRFNDSETVVRGFVSAGFLIPPEPVLRFSLTEGGVQ